MGIYLKNFEIVQQLDIHEVVKNKDTLDKWVLQLGANYRSIEQMCGIIHDKDTESNGKPKTPHFHLYVRMKTNQDVEWIAKVFGVPTNMIQKIRGKWKDALAYATHLNVPHKHLYEMTTENLTLFNMTLNQYQEEAQKVNLEDITIKEAIRQYGNLKLTKTQLMKEYLTDFDQYAKYSQLIKKAQEYRTMQVKERMMKVIYITGGSGSGKTTLAKYLAQTQGYDYFVSGSGSDVLDSYDREECIILDDIRSESFSKADMFKLTDNHTNSSVKSRFKNKDISNCKLMILTSIMAPHELYDWISDSKEPFEQFSRRLGHQYVMIDDAKLYQVDYDLNFDVLNNRKFKTSLMPFSMEMVFAVLGIQQQVGNDSFWKDIYSATIEQIKNTSK